MIILKKTRKTAAGTVCPKKNLKPSRSRKEKNLLRLLPMITNAIS